MEIDLEEFLSENADRSNPYKYLLHGFVHNSILVILLPNIFKLFIFVHNGGVHGGQYHAMLKTEKDGKWFVIFFLKNIKSISF